MKTILTLAAALLMFYASFGLTTAQAAKPKPENRKKVKEKKIQYALNSLDKKRENQLCSKKYWFIQSTILRHGQLKNFATR